MKLHFEPNLDYQLEAIDAVCDLFLGQKICPQQFTVTKNALDSLYVSYTDSHHYLGIGNRLTLLDDEILKNLNAVQRRGGLPPSPILSSGDFTVEMETGTGKTYVYLRTIFELNKRYGFTKFVIIVPSIAIKEGVYKSLQITEEHFKSLYAGVPFDYFLYDSSKLGQVRNFATSSQIQIMVVTVGAINKKDINNLYKDSEKTGGEKPIDLIKATQPILIVDEPQSVDGGLSGAGKKALDAMHPLCILRYSATHTDKYHMIYRLDAVDAYERKLVKQIEVASATIEGAHNKPFMRLISTSNKQGTISAKVELDIDTPRGVKRREVIVQDGDDLEQTTKRAIYHKCYIGEIRVGTGKESIELRVPGGKQYINPGTAYGDVDALIIQREMIRRTIKEHLDKELRLRPQGIKVLSLFFIDAVDRYRKYDENGNQIKGPYAHIFEEEYKRLASHPEYALLFQKIDLQSAASEAHDGYFSIDKHGGWTDTAENNQSNRDNAERAYNLIMKDKEKLLSFSTPLKFIFSHSALREGWDNPNIFQICSLRDIQTNRERRQTIGRGLRLCVNQHGERIRGFETNTLTVVATESYEQFAENLQKEIEADTGIRFGIVEQYLFTTITILGPNGQATPMSPEQSLALWENLKNQGYIDTKGRVQDLLKKALKEGSLSVPEPFMAQLEQINQILRRQAGRLDIKNANERRQVRTRQAVLHSPEFKALWDRIKHQTIYRVQFDNEMLIANCIQALQDAPIILKTRLQWRKANLAIGKASVTTKESTGADTISIKESDIELPDLLTDLQDRTQLTRRSIRKILTECGRLDDFKSNPQQFIELAAEVINHRKRLALVDGIKYQRLGDKYYYAQELFEEKELTGYLKNMIPSKKSVYDHVVYDSEGVERPFAEELENHDAVKVYAKLPGWFKIPTPLGTYNPDWAVLIEQEGTERVYFVVETKSSYIADERRKVENAKIDCAREHFSALKRERSAAEYLVATSLNDILHS